AAAAANRRPPFSRDPERRSTEGRHGSGPPLQARHHPGGRAAGCLRARRSRIREGRSVPGPKGVRAFLVWSFSFSRESWLPFGPLAHITLCSSLKDRWFRRLTADRRVEPCAFCAPGFVNFLATSSRGASPRAACRPEGLTSP